MKFFAREKTLQELNIGGSLVTAALEEACGVGRSKITEMYNELGDLGTYNLHLLCSYHSWSDISHKVKVISITCLGFFYV